MFMHGYPRRVGSTAFAVKLYLVAYADHAFFGDGAEETALAVERFHYLLMVNR